MSSSITPSRAFDRSEPVPGYKTVELIGRGGYGEVWRAIAPGGIAKAVKIVYGDVDRSHADSELRSLARIKDVRHPLLLSIERIEVVDGNLIIITELADCSLKDQFQRVREANLLGVPQDELLQYMADAAEALDFLYARYSLQHLDVKPENILIVSDRAKVGDFGLVKNLYERSVSLVGGLTPTYAPPELFEGRPTSHSDQYSLAIVYAQMLTGVLPFTASNTAQLAALHLRGVPDLSALPKRQRPVIARALSKDPLQRFGSCTEMVNELKESVKKGDLSQSQSQFTLSAPEVQPLRSDISTRSIASPSETNSTEAPGWLDSRPAVGASRGVGPESPGEISRPIVLVGVGGTGVLVLSKIVERLHNRFGGLENWPSLEILALDSNSRELNSRFQDNDLGRVRLVPIPLKSADALGSQAASFLKWLGRRWFYNIPRDLTTSGFRPLGRLALLTHGARVREAIAAVLSNALSRTDSQAIAGDNRPAPRVLLIGSICGGTGGGTILDLAYAIRSELKRCGLSDELVDGVLLHASSPSLSDRDLARANAYATLSELQHFSRPGGHFPGEPLMGASPFHGDNATFGHTHLIDLGDVGEQAGWELVADQVAEFLYGTNFSPACCELDGSSSSPDAPSGNAASEPRASTSTVLSLGAGMAPAVAQAVRLACGDVIRLWQEGSIASAGSVAAARLDRTQIITSFLPCQEVSTAQRHDDVEREVTERRLDLDSLLGDVAEVIELETGSDSSTFIRRLVDESLTATREHVDQGGNTPNRAAAIIALIDRFFRGDARSGTEKPQGDQFFTQLVVRMNARLRGRLNSLLDSLRSLVDTAEVRIEGARRRAVAVEQYLQTVQESAMTTAAALRETAITISVAASSEETLRPERSRFFGLGPRRKNTEDKLRDVLTSYVEARLSELLYRMVVRIVPIIDAELAALVEQLDRLSRELARLVGPSREMKPSWTAVEDELPQEAPAATLAFQQLLLSQLQLRRIDVARKIEEALERQLFDSGHGIRRFLDPETELQRLLWQPLQEQSRRAVLECLQEIKGQLISGGVSGLVADEAAELGTLIAGSFRSERIAEQSHETRRVLIVPDDADSSQLQEHLRSQIHELEILRGRKCDITICTIRSHRSLESVAEEIIGGQDIYKDLARRLHSRIDIPWQSFLDAVEDLETLGFDQNPSNPTQTAAISV